MKSLHKKISAMALAGMLVIGGALSSSLSVAHADSSSLEAGLSSQQREDLKSIIHRGEGKYIVVGYDGNYPSFEDNVPLKAKAVKYYELMKALKAKDGLKKIGLMSGQSYLLRIKDIDLQVLLYII